MIGVGLDAGLLLRSLTDTLGGLGMTTSIAPSFVPENRPDLAARTAPMARPPEDFRPDRPEVMNPVGSGKKFEIDRGVVFECLVGAHNGAKNLTTGIVTFAPTAQLAAAEAKRRVCACREQNERLHDLQQDLTLESTQTERYAFPPEWLTNPFGTRRGHIKAWLTARDLILRRGIHA